MKLHESIALLDRDERKLPLVVDFVNFHSEVVHLKLKETGSVEDTCHEICKSYGLCDVIEFSSDTKVYYLIGKRKEK